MKLIIRSVTAIAVLGLSVLAQAEVAVIVSAGSVAAPSKAEAANIFLGKNKSFQGIDQKDWNPVKEKFYSEVTSKSEAQLKSYWSGLIFTGKGQPLPAEADDAAVVAKVANNPSAIGYVDSAAVDESVKVLFTLP
ncbi:phosphate ABC transporter substrate-binding protein [Pseudomonas sp. B392_1p]|uniref:phosphate ABC transporter substrate-binding protein n=1 Tax=Pseudomonas sp. B392_1p TaxID=3457507 RepID=UPI003FD4B072